MAKELSIMKNTEKRDLVIIGAGPAGLSAAIYAKRAGLDIVLLEKGLIGGQMNLTDKISNWPGTEYIKGAELSQNFKMHAENLQVEIRNETAESADFVSEIKTVITDKTIYKSKTVIVATGAVHTMLGCIGEKEFTGKGVSYCAVCDAAFFADCSVAVVGGGNAALEEAEFLTEFASKVYIIHRRNEFKADKIVIDTVLRNKKIIPVMNSIVKSVNGDVFVNSISVENLNDGKIMDITVKGIFIFIGNKPQTDILGSNSEVKVDENGYICVDDEMRTNIPAVFAAGDVVSKLLRQVVTSAADGAKAAVSAYKYIKDRVKK